MTVPVLAAFARVYVDDLDAALPTFGQPTGEQRPLRFTYRGLDLASVGGYLLLVAPYPGTHATTIVESRLRDAARSGWGRWGPRWASPPADHRVRAVPRHARSPLA
ncbi:hypothetical protein ACF1BE_13780 [Streptomyces sp. NPDC014991]|uniref:hypothetical protein n=1 Tax=Streptomyces sp. NPDC014991 TaxID=3364935 RepID=UPI0036FD9FDA